VHREIDKIAFLLEQCLEIFIYYLPEHSENALLARFIYDQNEIVQEVFGEFYEQLLEAMYQENAETLYILACRSLRQGGWIQKAQAALEKAIEINPQNSLIYQEKKLIDITIKKR
jgi:tetratricopeptide (TPR) repeat protein